MLGFIMAIYRPELFGSMLIYFRRNIKLNCQSEKVIDVVLMISGNQVLRWYVIYWLNNSFNAQRCRYAWNFVMLFATILIAIGVESNINHFLIRQLFGPASETSFERLRTTIDFRECS